MSFPRYPKYKDSGVEWLGQVPDHWKHAPVWLLFELGRGRVISHEEIMDNAGEYPVYSSQTEGDGIMGSLDTYAFDGDYLTWTTDGANAGTVFRRSGRFNCTNVCGTLKARSPEVLLGYSWHALAISTAAFVRHDINPKLMNNVMAKIRIPIPPLPEQTAIAGLLGKETAKIDALVAEQQRLMELLKEKRQAVISHAVTKGLNPNAPMKPSGIEWLGDVPAHWEVKPLKYSITKIEQGWSPQCESEPAAENQWGVLKVGCGNRDKFDPTEQKALPQDIVPLPNYEIRAGDILVSRGNTLELVGMATFVEKVRPRLLLCDLLYRFHAKPERAEGEFLVLSLRSPNVRFQIERDATGTSASMKKIGQGTIRQFLIALPPLDEQRAIIAFLRGETAKLNTLTSEAQRAIDLLQERRTALISAAVTGQIDVRSQTNQQIANKS